MVAYPQEMKVWATRAKCLCQSFDSGSKRMVEMVKDLFQFLNGDTKSDELIHYCKEDPDIPCCHSDTEALNRLASMLTSLFARGYPVPLLYRMKHYSFAAAFVRLGCMTHRLLPRILQEMNSTMSQDTPGSHLSEFIDALLEGSGVTKTDAEFETLLSSFLNEDVNYAAQNGARQKMVLRELSNRQFHQSSIMIDMMVQNWKQESTSFCGGPKCFSTCST